MGKNIGLFWLRDDFRLKKNLGLIEATKKHDEVLVFYLFKKKKFQQQEAQKWWLGKSLDEFKLKLKKFNINLEIIQTDSYKFFLKNFLKRIIFHYTGIELMSPITLNLISICQKIWK